MLFTKGPQPLLSLIQFGLFNSLGHQQHVSRIKVANGIQISKDLIQIAGLTDDELQLILVHSPALPASGSELDSLGLIDIKSQSNWR